MTMKKIDILNVVRQSSQEFYLQNYIGELTERYENFDQALHSKLKT